MIFAIPRMPFECLWQPSPRLWAYLSNHALGGLWVVCREVSQAGFQVSATDPATFAAVVGLLALVALLA
jgi:hypothetical protein